MSLNNAQWKEARFDIDTLLIRTTVVSSEIMPGEDKALATRVNTLLSAEKTRQKGLETLNLILDCGGLPSETVPDLLFWVNHCLVKYVDDNLREIKLNTITKIVKNANDNQEFTKRFLSEFLSKILETCLVTTHVKSFACEAGLQTLTTCMKHYGSWFGQHRARIEGFLTQFLDNDDEKLVKAASFAFHYLQQVGGAGSEGINHRKNFSKAFHKLCATVHRLLDEFFKAENEIGNYNRNDEEYYTFNVSSVDSYRKKHVLCRQIINCILFLETMIRTKFPVAKDTKPKRLLDIILRGMSIHHCLTSDNKRDMELYTNSSTLNKIQEQFLYLLRWTVTWYNANILPFCYIINKLLLDCLKRTQNCSCFLGDCLYQEVVYKTLNEWLRISKNSMHINFQNQLVTYILKDITPNRSQITLTICTDNSKNLSKKARKKAVQEKIISSGKTTTKTFSNSQEANLEQICKLALQTLQVFFTNSTVKIDNQLIKQIYSVVLSSILDLQTGTTYLPYKNPDCQIGLYKVLRSFYEQTTITVHPPLGLSLQVFNNGVNSDNRFISSVCEKGLFALEKFCQPVCPSLYLNTRPAQEVETAEVVVPNDFELLDELAPKAYGDNPIDSPDYLVDEQCTRTDNRHKNSVVKCIDLTENNSDLSDNVEIVNEFTTSNISLASSDLVDPVTSNSGSQENIIIQNVSILRGPDSNIENAQEVNGIEVIEDEIGLIEPPLKKTKFVDLEPINKKTGEENLEEFVFEDDFDFGDDFVDEVKDY